MISPLLEFADDILYGAGGYKSLWHELAVENYEHDVCIVLWTLKCLANAENPATAEILQAINNHRAAAPRQARPRRGEAEVLVLDNDLIQLI